MRGVTLSLHRFDRSTDADDRVSRMLARWADAHRPSARQIEAIRQRIISEPTPADFDWWWQLLNPDGGSAFRGLSGRSGWEAAPDAFPTPVHPAIVWHVGVSDLPIWTHDEPELQPYLRLT